MVILIRIIGPVRRTGPEGAPEGATVQACFQTGNVDMTVQATLREGFTEGLIVDVVVVKCPDPDGQVIVAVCPRV